jgi:hypothetical protein
MSNHVNHFIEHLVLILQSKTKTTNDASTPVFIGAGEASKSSFVEDAKFFTKTNQ